MLTLNNLGDDAVLIITNHGYARLKKQGYYCTEPFKSQYEKIIAMNKEIMAASNGGLFPIY